MQLRASKRSARHSINKPRLSNTLQKPVSNYRPHPRLLPDFDTIQQADVEAASKLCDIAFATTDQAAQRQKLFSEDEIEYEKKNVTLIEQTQRTLDHENDLSKIENAHI